MDAGKSLAIWNLGVNCIDLISLTWGHRGKQICLSRDTWVDRAPSRYKTTVPDIMEKMKASDTALNLRMN